MPTRPAGSRTRLLDEAADLLWRGEHDGSAIALHAGADDHRIAGQRAEFARVGFETQVEFPYLVRLSVRGLHRVRVAAMAERLDARLGRRLAQIRLATAHSHHALLAAPR